jgi:hypothetical protein
MNSVITQVIKTLPPSKFTFRFPLDRKQYDNFRIQSEKAWVRFCEEKNSIQFQRERRPVNKLN